MPGPEDLLEWVPHEVQEAMRQPRFRRLTPDERTRVQGREVPAAYLRPKRFARPSDPGRTAAPTVVIAPPARPPARQPGIDDELTRRLTEVEAAVSRAADAVDRRAERVQTMLAEAIATRVGKRPG